MTDQTFLMRYADNESPRFDGSVYAIKCSTVVKHKGVDVQGVTTTDLHEGDDIVYQYTYKHGRTRLWKGVVVRTESDTVQLVLSESSANSDADCISDASAGSNNEAKRTSAQSETILKGKRKSRKRTQKKAENLPPKKVKGGECTCTYIGLICCWWVCCLLLVGLLFVVGGFVVCCWWVCCLLLVGLLFVVGGFVVCCWWVCCLLVGLICCWWVCCCWWV